jgi:hypothetical protein
VYTSNKDTALTHEEIWSAWVQKGRLLDQAIARKVRVLGIALFIVALAIALYVFALRQTSLVET